MPGNKAPGHGWWNCTTLYESVHKEAASPTVEDISQLSRPGFKIIFHNWSDNIMCPYLRKAAC